MTCDKFNYDCYCSNNNGAINVYFVIIQLQRKFEVLAQSVNKFFQILSFFYVDCFDQGYYNPIYYQIIYDFSSLEIKF